MAEETTPATPSFPPDAVEIPDTPEPSFPPEATDLPPAEAIEDASFEAASTQRALEDAAQVDPFDLLTFPLGSPLDDAPTWASPADMIRSYNEAGLGPTVSMERAEAYERQGNLRNFQFMQELGIPQDSPFTLPLRRLHWALAMVEDQPVDPNAVLRRTPRMALRVLQRLEVPEEVLEQLSGAPEAAGKVLQLLMDPDERIGASRETQELLDAALTSIGGPREPGDLAEALLRTATTAEDADDVALEMIAMRARRAFHDVAAVEMRRHQLQALGLFPEGPARAGMLAGGDTFAGEIDPVEAMPLAPVLQSLGEVLPAPREKPNMPPLERIAWARANHEAYAEEVAHAEAIVNGTVPMQLFRTIGGILSAPFMAMAEGIGAVDRETGLRAIESFQDIMDEKQAARALEHFLDAPLPKERPFSHYTVWSHYDAVARDEAERRGKILELQRQYQAGEALDVEEIQRTMGAGAAVAYEQLQAWKEVELADLHPDDRRQAMRQIWSHAAWFKSVADRTIWRNSDEFFARLGWAGRQVQGLLRAGLETLNGIYALGEGDEHTISAIVSPAILRQTLGRSVTARQITYAIKEFARRWGPARRLVTELKRMPKPTARQYLRNAVQVMDAELKKLGKTAPTGVRSRVAAKVLENATQAARAIVEEQELLNAPGAAWTVRYWGAVAERIFGPRAYRAFDPTGWLSPKIFQQGKLFGFLPRVQKYRQFLDEAAEARHRWIMDFLEGDWSKTLPESIGTRQTPRPQLFSRAREYGERLLTVSNYEHMIDQLFRVRARAEGRALRALHQDMKFAGEQIARLSGHKGPGVTGARRAATAWRKKLKGYRSQIQPQEARVRALSNAWRDFRRTAKTSRGYELPTRVVELLEEPTTFRLFAGWYPEFLELQTILAGVRAGAKRTRLIRQGLSLERPSKPLGAALTEMERIVRELEEGMGSGSQGFAPPFAFDRSGTGLWARHQARRVIGDRLRYGITRSTAGKIWLERMARTWVEIERTNPELAQSIGEGLRKLPTARDRRLAFAEKIMREAFKLADDDPLVVRTKQWLTELTDFQLDLNRRAVRAGLSTNEMLNDFIRRGYEPHVFRAFEFLDGGERTLPESVTLAGSTINLVPWRRQSLFERHRIIRKVGDDYVSESFTTVEKARRKINGIYGDGTWQRLVRKRALEKEGIYWEPPLRTTAKTVLDMDPNYVRSLFTQTENFHRSVAKAELLTHLKVDGIWVPPDKVATIPKEKILSAKNKTGPYVRIPNSKRFGPLRGGMVHREALRSVASASDYSTFLEGVRGEITGILAESGASPISFLSDAWPFQLYRKARSGLMTGWILANATTWLNNPTFNVYCAQYAGIPPWALFSKSFRKGIRKWQKGHKDIRALQELGVDLRTAPLSGVEGRVARNWLEYLTREGKAERVLRLQDRLGEIEGNIGRVGRFTPKEIRSFNAQRAAIESELNQLTGRGLGRAAMRGAKAVGKEVRDRIDSGWGAYSAIDPAMRAGYAQWLLDRGLSMPQAAYRLTEFFQNYAMVPHGVRRLGNNPLAAPIVSFSYEWFRLMYNHMVKQPGLFMALHGANMVSNEAALMRAGMSLEQYARMHGGKDPLDLFLLMMNRTILGSSPSGHLAEVDHGNVKGTNILSMPMGQVRELGLTLSERGGLMGRIAGAGLSIMSRFVLNTPVVSWLNIADNKEPFSQRPVWDSDDSGMEAAGKMLRAMWKSVAPPVAPGGYQYDLFRKGSLDTWRGRDVPLAERVFRPFGVEVTTRTDAWMHLIRSATQLEPDQGPAFRRSLYGEWVDVHHALNKIFGATGDEAQVEAEVEELRRFLGRDLQIEHEGEEYTLPRREEMAQQKYLEKLAGMGPFSYFMSLELPEKAWALNQAVEMGLDKWDPETFKTLGDSILWGTNQLLRHPENLGGLRKALIPPSRREKYRQLRESLARAMAENPTQVYENAARYGWLRSYAGEDDLPKIERALEHLHADQPGRHPMLDRWIHSLSARRRLNLEGKARKVLRGRR